MWTVKKWSEVVQSCPTLRPHGHQVPPSMGFSRQEYWSGLPFPSLGNFPTQGLNPGLPHCRQILYRLSHQGNLTLLYSKYLEIFLFFMTNTLYPWDRASPKSHTLLPATSNHQQSIFCFLWLWLPQILISGIMQHLSFCGWLISHSIMPSSFIHAVA